MKEYIKPEFETIELYVECDNTFNQSPGSTESAEPDPEGVLGFD